MPAPHTHTRPLLSLALAPQFLLVALSFPPSIPPLSFHHCPPTPVPPTCLPHQSTACQAAGMHARYQRRSGGPPHHPLGERHPSPVPAYSTKHQKKATLPSQYAAKTFQHTHTNTHTHLASAPLSAAAAHLRPLGLSTRLNPSLFGYLGPRESCSPLLLPPPPFLLLLHACAPCKVFRPPHHAPLSSCRHLAISSHVLRWV